MLINNIRTNSMSINFMLPTSMSSFIQHWRWSLIIFFCFDEMSNIQSCDIELSKWLMLVKNVGIDAMTIHELLLASVSSFIAIPNSRILIILFCPDEMLQRTPRKIARCYNLNCFSRHDRTIRMCGAWYDTMDMTLYLIEHVSTASVGSW